MAATEQARRLALVAANAAADKKAHDVVVLDVSNQLVITDCFVIASAPNERQVGAIVDNIEEKMRSAGTKPVRREGAREGRWVLLDFVDVVVHVQHVEERSFYGLERLWKDCPRIPFDPMAAAGGEEPSGDEDPQDTPETGDGQ
ncbi:ribosome silencing factor [Goodfellowiella coeruleoviolacea]|uniref:Ribosomal silencing factor RsfS n=1 Tax=Goodfellowiella coeruleoviolacea TaxID=334858 RepID=A0AAE3KFL9_9PSEU|nr:ribosome silencing factor [Goodfellowiella coeruleoviolacea]MCP2165127.1 ribosome-associated protein [Goodfellowiella coeruleoviolacea]